MRRQGSRRSASRSWRPPALRGPLRGEVGGALRPTAGVPGGARPLQDADHMGPTRPPGQLGSWINTQRTAKKKHDNGDEKAGITPERIQKLDEVGFEWEIFL